MITSREKILKMVQLSLLAALEVLLTLLYIPVGAINMNFGLVPIVVAGVFLGPAAGAVIGGVSGLVTMIQVITGQSVFYTFLMAVNPVAACLLCLIKTSLAGVLVGVVYRVMSKICRSITVNSLVTAIVCPVVNTGVFALGMLLVFDDALVLDPVISTWAVGGAAAIVFVALIGINFFVELAVTAIVSPALCKTLSAAKIFSGK